MPLLKNAMENYVASNAPFIHLRVHTAYSLCEGAVKIPDLVTACEQEVFPAIAITDTNNMFGIMEFTVKTSEHGIQPIIGTTLNLKFDDIIAPIPLLAKTEQGYGHLMKLMTSFYFHNNRFITLHDLEQHCNDIICLSGGVSGIAGKLIAEKQTDKAKEYLDALSNIFGNNLYIEISRMGEVGEVETEEFCVNYAIDTGTSLVATNEVFFLTKDMHMAQDALMCIADATYIDVQERRKLTSEHYLKTSQEMFELFSDIPEAVLNTSIIAKRCSFMPEKKKPELPLFLDDAKINEDEIMENKARLGLEEKLEIVKNYKSNINKDFSIIEREYRDRFDYEISVIKKMGFCGYFLIVSDFVKWSKEHDIPVGPGRGSGAGSIVAWCMHITELDPIKYTLLFERFLNPERVSMPDFDIDFCQFRRNETIEYVQRKYGKNRVAHIIALGKLQARNVVRDVGRVLQMPYGQVDKIAKLIPQNPTDPVTLKQALDIEPQLKDLVAQDSQIKFLIDTAMQLEGLYRHASMHAAGIVIGNKSIDEIVPVYSDGETSLAITQFNMKYVEMTGLVKFDFLGLKTLTVIQYAINDIKKYKGVEIDINSIDMEDLKTFKLLCDVDVVGVFQLESGGMKDVIRNLQPDNIEDIIALISLFRPGPMDNIPTYLARKHGKEFVKYLHPILEPILKPTYGVMIYQEQVMQIAQKMAGYSLAEADLLRRAMGKKIREEMARNRTIFEEGAKKNNISARIAGDVFDMMAKFASYGFNRSHAAAYGVISYQTAWLKANYRLEFYTASLNLELTNTDKIAIFIQDAKQSGITILPPNINKSEALFIEEGDKSIRYALGALKGSGQAVMEELVADRNSNGLFKNVFDFFKRATKIRAFNAKHAEALIFSGSLDCLHNNRHQLHASIKSLLELGNENSNVKQFSLFGELSPSGVSLANVPEWQVLEKLDYERQAITFYLTAHPMELYNELLKSMGIVNSKDFSITNNHIKVAGMLMGKRERLSKTGQKYAFAMFSDTSNSFEVTVFPDLYGKVREYLQIGKPYIMTVDIEGVGEKLNIHAVEVQDLDILIKKQKIYIDINNNTNVHALREFLDKCNPGDNKIYFFSKDQYGQNYEINTGYSRDLTLTKRKYLKDKLNINIMYL